MNIQYRTIVLCIILCITFMLLIGCSDLKNNTNLSGTKTSDSVLKPSRDKIKAGMDDFLAKTDGIAKYEFADTSYSNVNIYLNAEMIGGTYNKKKEFAEVVANYIGTITNRFSYSGINVYFKSNAENKLLYYIEDGTLKLAN